MPGAIIRCAPEIGEGWRKRYTRKGMRFNYCGSGEWYTLDLDYQRVADILRKANYTGYISLEFEGKAPADEGVAKSIDLFRSVFS